MFMLFLKAMMRELFFSHSPIEECSPHLDIKWMHQALLIWSLSEEDHFQKQQLDATKLSSAQLAMTFV